MGKFMGA